MKKGFIALVVIFVIIALFVITKKTSNAPSDDITGTTAEIETETGTMPTPPTTATPATSSDQLPTSSATIKETIVAYGPQGFTPKTVTIKIGEMATFVNESENSMWVAASKHPVHADYPEKTDKDCLGSAFDQCTASGIGTSYSFTFNKKGSWNYHNHVNPSHWGTIVVE